MKNTCIISSLLVLLSGCTTTTHYGSRPKLDEVEIGMNKSQVYEVLGKPAKVSTDGEVTYLSYGWDSPWDGRIGATEEYYVRLRDGLVDSLGEKGDFDSTKNPTINVNKNINTRNSSEKVDIYSELTKLKDLLDQGIITQEEFDERKKIILSS
jgi:hypothetical protein